jgi:hypothetical protein
MVHLVAPALCQSCIAGIAKRPHMHVRPWQCYVLHGPFGARTSGPRIRFPDRRDGPFFFCVGLHQQRDHTTNCTDFPHHYKAQ